MILEGLSLKKNVSLLTLIIVYQLIIHIMSMIELFLNSYKDFYENILSSLIL